jgi:hypothetical protein
VKEYYFLKDKDNDVIEFIDEYVDGCLTRFFSNESKRWINAHGIDSLDDSKGICPYILESATEDEVNTVIMLLELNK